MTNETMQVRPRVRRRVLRRRRASARLDCSSWTRGNPWTLNVAISGYQYRVRWVKHRRRRHLGLDPVGLNISGGEDTTTSYGREQASSAMATTYTFELRIRAGSVADTVYSAAVERSTTTLPYANRLQAGEPHSNARPRPRSRLR